MRTDSIKKVTIITGHYGSGKTNIAVNLAVTLKEAGKNCRLVDLDIVNPYFRSADFKVLLAEKGISLAVSEYANSNLDIPSLNLDFKGILSRDEYIIVDVGGDDAGAVALGRYSEIFGGIDDIDMFCVINAYRYLTRKPNEAVTLMREIEAASRLKCTGLINNSNLGSETTSETILASKAYADSVSAETGLPVVATSGKRELITAEIENPFPVEIYVKPIWNQI